MSALRKIPLLIFTGLLVRGSAMAGLTVYSHGEPTDLEQLMVEWINQARQDPVAQAQLLGFDFASDPASTTYKVTPTRKQPLAINPQALAAARAHCQWMVNNNTVSHSGAGGSAPNDRMKSAGYPFSGSPQGWGETIGWYQFHDAHTAESLLREVMQNLFVSRLNGKVTDHRRWMMEPLFREIGPGITDGTAKLEGAPRHVLMTSQSYAVSDGSPAGVGGFFLVGVVYDDKNGDGAYGLGEGVPGVEITPNPGDYCTVTSKSGGYAIPVGKRQGSVTLTFRGFGGEHPRVVSLSGRENVKVDLRKQDLPPPVAQTNGGFAAWMASQGAAKGGLPLDDPDGDGAVNLLEYAALTRADLSDQTGQVISRTPYGIAWEFMVAAAPDLSYSVECSTEGGPWRAVSSSSANGPLGPPALPEVTVTEENAQGLRRLRVVDGGHRRSRMFRLAVRKS